MSVTRRARRIIAILVLSAGAIPTRAGGDSLVAYPEPVVRGGEVGRTRETSTPGKIDVVKAPRGAPNVVIILLDDVGYSAASTFGGAVSTGTLDKLAREGLRYNAFHTTGICSATRAALLTGRNHHAAGTGNVVELARGYPGYSGIIPKSTATIAEILRRRGYSTALFGKHHNTPVWEIGPSGPFDRWPTGLGFQRFYGFIAGEAHQWSPVLYENTTAVDRPEQPEYHFTEDIAEQAILWMRQQKAVDPNKPFLLYWAPGATHAPHHVYRKWISKYEGRFDDGWDVLREETFVRQKKLGVIPSNAKLTPRPAEIPSWGSLTPVEKRIAARLMEAFAGFLDHTDHQVGRLVQTLRDLGEWENTLFFYIVGDNGGSAEGGLHGLFNELSAFNGVPEDPDVILERLEEIGGPTAYNHFPVGFAWATNTPFQWAKQVASHLGGTRNPLVVTWPARIGTAGGLRPQFHHIVDVFPTILEGIGISAPTQVDGVGQKPVDGVSMMYSFNDAGAAGRRRTQYFEIMGNRAIYHQGWMASARHGRLPWTMVSSSTSFDDDVWELYDLRNDFAQAEDLAEKRPEQLRDLQELFWREARIHNVLPLDDRVHDGLGEGTPTRDRSRFTYPPRTSLTEWLAPNLKNRSHSITVDIDRNRADTEGVLAAQGGSMAGWSFFLKGGRLTYVYNHPSFGRTSVVATEALDPGRSDVGFVFEYDGNGRGQGARVLLFVGEKTVGEGRIRATVPVLFSSNETFDVGRDRGSPVGPYDGPFAFTGILHELRVDLK